MMRSVVLVAYEGAQLLDLTGPASVFTEARSFLRKPGYDVQIASTRGGAVRTGNSVDVMTVRLGDLPQRGIDTVIIPGAESPGLRAAMKNFTLRSWLLSTGIRARRLASVCTGAFVLAELGLLDGRRATTHWQAASDLVRRYPKVKVEPQALFVEDGKIWTSAGVSTGIDMSLALVERDFGRHVATAIAKRLVLSARRPGHQSQFSSLLQAQAGSYAKLIEWIEHQLEANLSLEVLADRACQAPRTFHRRFTAELGQTPAAFVERLRLDRARTLLEAGGVAKQVAKQSGFESLDRLGRRFQKAFGLTPSAYRTLHQRMPVRSKP